MANDNVIRLAFSSTERQRDERDLGAMEILRKMIDTFANDPPSTEFQLGYLFGVVDAYKDAGGLDFTDLALYYSKRLSE